MYEPVKQLGPFRFFAWSVVIGVVGALGAVVFRGLIALFHNLLFLGQWSVVYDANATRRPARGVPSSSWCPWWARPAWLSWSATSLPRPRGMACPEVMDAIYYHKGVVRPIVALIKSLASALVDRQRRFGRPRRADHPDWLLVRLDAWANSCGVPVWQRITLIAAGAGAGIAATFNTPIGGVLFAVEIMLHEVSARTLVPVAIATVTASYIGRLFFGSHPSFVIPAFEIPYFHPTNPLVLCLYVGLGVLVGLVSVVYIRSIYAFEDFFEQRIKGNYYTRHLLGMFAVGVMMIRAVADHRALPDRGRRLCHGAGRAFGRGCRGSCWCCLR